jgi:hypothetical protein
MAFIIGSKLLPYFVMEYSTFGGICGKITRLTIMETVLYITAHPNDHQASFSMAVGKQFIDAYREIHPDDEIIHWICTQ